MIEINKAWEIIGNSEKKMQYDEFLSKILMYKDLKNISFK